MFIPRLNLWRRLANLLGASTNTLLSIAGVARVADGTAAIPSVSFTSNPNTGLRSLGSGSNAIDFVANATSAMTLGSASLTLRSTHIYGFSSGDPSAVSADVAVGRSGANALVFGGGSVVAGAVTSRCEINKAVASIPDATPTTVFTVTIPNAAHSASIRVKLVGSLGAGGAIGANESTQDATYNIAIARTSGVNAVATISAVSAQPAAASVAGAANAAVVGTLGAIAGIVSASNTFTILVTITKSGGASANHTCVAYAELINANATGVTIA